MIRLSFLPFPGRTDLCRGPHSILKNKGKLISQQQGNLWRVVNVAIVVILSCFGRRSAKSAQTDRLKVTISFLSIGIVSPKPSLFKSGLFCAKATTKAGVTTFAIGLIRRPGVVVRMTIAHRSAERSQRIFVLKDGR